MNADMMRGKSNPQALTCTDKGERCCSWALHLPWPGALPASGLLAGLRSHRCNTRGVGARGLWQSRGSRWERPPHGEAWHGVDAPLRECKQVLIELEESDLVRVTHKGGGTHQDTERRQPNEGHSPLETTEEGICRDTGRRRPHKEHP